MSGKEKDAVERALARLEEIEAEENKARWATGILPDGTGLTLEVRHAWVEAGPFKTGMTDGPRKPAWVVIAFVRRPEPSGGFSPSSVSKDTEFRTYEEACAEFLRLVDKYRLTVDAVAGGAKGGEEGE